MINIIISFANAGISSFWQHFKKNQKRKCIYTIVPKTTNGLWEKFISFENFLKAFNDAAKTKRESEYVLRFKHDLEHNLFELIDSIKNGKWKPDKFSIFKVYEPKLRIIHAPKFHDRVVHHAIYNVIKPLFERKFINASFACRTGKGTHKASYFLRDMLKRANNEYSRIYFLKADIHHYFPSVNHEILMNIIGRTIRDKRILELIKKIIFTSESGGRTGNGLPIGSLTSQLFANVYLNELDHYIKDRLRIKYYCRYMDDFIILLDNKNLLKDIKGNIEHWINFHLDLGYNHKSFVSPISRGIDFVGFRHWVDLTKYRKRVVKHAKETFKSLMKLMDDKRININSIEPVLASFLGYTKHCYSLTTSKNILKYLNL